MNFISIADVLLALLQARGSAGQAMGGIGAFPSRQASVTEDCRVGQIFKWLDTELGVVDFFKLLLRKADWEPVVKIHGVDVAAPDPLPGHDCDHFIACLSLARSELLVLDDYDPLFLRKFSLQHQSRFFFTMYTTWPADKFIKFAKYHTVDPLAALLNQPRPVIPDGFQGESIVWTGSVRRYLRSRLHRRTSVSVRLCWGLLQGVKRGAAVVPESFILEALRNHASLLKVAPPAVEPEELVHCARFLGEIHVAVKTEPLVWKPVEPSHNAAYPIPSSIREEVVHLQMRAREEADEVIRRAGLEAARWEGLHDMRLKWHASRAIHQYAESIGRGSWEADDDLRGQDDCTMGKPDVPCLWCRSPGRDVLTRLDSRISEINFLKPVCNLGPRARDGQFGIVDRLVSAPFEQQNPYLFSKPIFRMNVTRARILGTLLLHYPHLRTAVCTLTDTQLVGRRFPAHVIRYFVAVVKLWKEGGLPLRELLHCHRSPWAAVRFPDAGRVRAVPVLEPLKVRTITAGAGLFMYYASPVQKWLKSHLDHLRQFRLTTRPLLNDDLIQLWDDGRGVLNRRGLDYDESWGFLSGDYKEATDRVHLGLTKLFFESFLERSGMSDLEKEVCRQVLYEQVIDYGPKYGKHVPEVVQRNGQLMGSVLSFGLLCLINLYCAWRAFNRYLALRGVASIGVAEVPVLVNGDDILFLCCPVLYGFWQEEIEKALFRLSVGKNYFDRFFLTVNSTGFRLLNHAEAIRGALPVFEKVPYLNVGLLTGQGKLAKVSEKPIWDIANKVLDDACDKSRALRRFLRYNRTELKIASQDGLLNFFVPISFGGLGIIPPPGWNDWGLTWFQRHLARACRQSILVHGRAPQGARYTTNREESILKLEPPPSFRLGSRLLDRFCPQSSESIDGGLLRVSPDMSLTTIARAGPLFYRAPSGRLIRNARRRMKLRDEQPLDEKTIHMLWKFEVVTLDRWVPVREEGKKGLCLDLRGPHPSSCPYSGPTDWVRSVVSESATIDGGGFSEPVFPFGRASHVRHWSFPPE